MTFDKTDNICFLQIFYWNCTYNYLFSAVTTLWEM